MAKTSSASKKPSVSQSGNIPVTNPTDLAAVYSNNFGVSATLTDFTIFFLELGQVPGVAGSIPKQEVKAIVTLPLMAGPGLVDVLQQMLQGQAEKMQDAVKMRKSVQ
jgi:hypothetical protein